MEIYKDDPGWVNSSAGEVENTAFPLPPDTLPPRLRKRRRRIGRNTWASIAAAIVRQHGVLPENSPRRRPTLARVRFLERPIGEAA